MRSCRVKSNKKLLPSREATRFETAMKKALLCFSLILALLPSCKNELEIIGPQEEVMVVYAILNKFDSIQYIKINKGFASQDESPIELAKDVDNLFFDSLQVTLINLTSGFSVNCEKLMIQKNEGLFSNAVNYVYTTDLQLTENHIYTLKVLNPLSGKEVKAQLKMLGSPSPNTPNSLNINTYPIQPDKPMSINYDAAPNTKAYEIRMNFIYEEINALTNEVIRDTIPWTLTQSKFDNNLKINFRQDGKLFYEHLAATLEVKGNEISRRGIALEFEYWGGDNELSTYMDVYGTSSIGVVQKKTDYTNIDGGYGIFASRNLFKITSSGLDVRTKSELKNSIILSPFNFVD